MNLLCLLLWFAVCADQDARCRKVSNWLTFGAGLLALAYLLTEGSSWLGSPGEHAWWALVLTLVMTLPGYALNRLGAGDVKLLVAVALASDHLHVLGTFVGAGIASVSWLLMRQKICPHIPQYVRSRYPQLAPQASNKLPYVPFLFAGFLAAALCLH